MHTLPNLSRFGCIIMLYPHSVPLNLHLYPCLGQKPKANQSGKYAIVTGQRRIRRHINHCRVTLNPIRKLEMIHSVEGQSLCYITAGLNEKGYGCTGPKVPRSRGNHSNQKGTTGLSMAKDQQPIMDPNKKL